MADDLRHRHRGGIIATDHSDQADEGEIAVGKNTCRSGDFMYSRTQNFGLTICDRS